MQQKSLKQDNPIWINAWYDPLASSCSFSQCMTLVDIFGEGNYKLVVGVSNSNPLLRTNVVINEKQMEAKLRTFKGTSLLDEIILIDTPVAVVSYYPDSKPPKKPFIAVACNNAIFLYKNLQPFHRFLTPSTPVEEKEIELWEQLKNGEIETAKAMEELMALRDDGKLLTQRSQELISMMDENRINIFVERFKMRPLTPSTNSITCMAVIKKDREDVDAVGMLIVGCENKKVYLLDPTGTKIVKEFILPSVASILSVSGKYDIEYRIVVGTRCGNIYSIRGGEVSGIVLEMDSHPVAISQLDKHIVVGTMSRAVHFFGSKAKKQFSLYMPSDIKAMEVLDLRQTKNVKCVAIALENKELRIYNGKSLVNIVQTVDTIVGMTFGTYGTEPNCLILNYRNGGLDFKILARKANIDSVKDGNGPPPEQDIPLQLPTKTNMYMELIAREKDNPLEMHKIFQKDLYKLRVNTAKQYLQVITDGQGPISFINAFPVQLDVEIQGIGPIYFVKVGMLNTGNKPMLKIPLFFQYNHDMFSISPSSMVIPVLIHGLKYKFQFEVKSQLELLTPDDYPIKLLVCGSEATTMTPALTYQIIMPPVEKI